MVKFRMNHGNHRKGEAGRRTSNLRYIVILVALLVLFVWLLTVNFNPLLEALLGQPTKAEVYCYTESGDIKMIDNLILAPAADGSGLLWMAHSSSDITNYGHRGPFEGGQPFMMPPGLTEFWTEDDFVYQFSKMDEGAFRILEEAYNQVYDWTVEYGELRVVAGMLYCSDSIAAYPKGDFVFISFLDVNSQPPTSVSLLWPNYSDERPLTEMIFSLAELNRHSNLNIFEDLLSKNELSRPFELQSLLPLGYNSDYYEKRLFFQRILNEE